MRKFLTISFLLIGVMSFARAQQAPAAGAPPAAAPLAEVAADVAQEPAADAAAAALPDAALLRAAFRAAVQPADTGLAPANTDAMRPDMGMCWDIQRTLGPVKLRIAAYNAGVSW